MKKLFRCLALFSLLIFSMVAFSGISYARHESGHCCDETPFGLKCYDSLCDSGKVCDTATRRCKNAPTCTPNCANKQCGSNDCGGSCGTCNSPPATNCADLSTLRTYSSTGTCSSSGLCSYTKTDTNCPNGCSDKTNACIEPKEPDCPKDLGNCHSSVECYGHYCGGVRYYCRNTDSKGYSWTLEFPCNSKNYCQESGCAGNVYFCTSRSNSFEKCPYGCENGECKQAPVCTSQCTAGETRCDGDYEQACADYNNDGCTEWPSSRFTSGSRQCFGRCLGNQCQNEPSIITFSSQIIARGESLTVTVSNARADSDINIYCAAPFENVPLTCPSKCRTNSDGSCSFSVSAPLNAYIGSSHGISTGGSNYYVGVVECLQNSHCNDASKPHCSEYYTCARCTSNSQCDSSTPICDKLLEGGTCKACQYNTECRNLEASKPYCSPSKTCVRCRKNSDCSGLNPLCSNGDCVGCNSHEQCRSANPFKPICSNGACSSCISNEQCRSAYSSKPGCMAGGLSAGACVECSQYLSTTVCNAGTTQCTQTCGGSSYSCIKIGSQWAWKTQDEINSACDNTDDKCTTYQYPNACTEGGPSQALSGKCYALSGGNSKLQPAWRGDNEEVCEDLSIKTQGQCSRKISCDTTTNTGASSGTYHFAPESRSIIVGSQWTLTLNNARSGDVLTVITKKANTQNEYAATCTVPPSPPGPFGYGSCIVRGTAVSQDAGEWTAQVKINNADKETITFNVVAGCPAGLGACNSGTANCRKQCGDTEYYCVSFDNNDATWSWKTKTEIVDLGCNVQCKTAKYPSGCSVINQGATHAVCYKSTSGSPWRWNNEQAPPEQCGNNIDDNCKNGVDDGCPEEPVCTQETGQLCNPATKQISSYNNGCERLNLAQQGFQQDLTKCASLPNLIVESVRFSVPDTPANREGTKPGIAEIRAVIKNTGTAAASGQFYVTAEIPAGYNYPNGFKASVPVFVVGETRVLGAGATKNVIIIDDSIFGGYAFPKDTNIKVATTVTVDSGANTQTTNLISESSENDNSRTTPAADTANLRLNSAGTILGDVNVDGEVVIGDVVGVQSHIEGIFKLSGIGLDMADVNGDNKVDAEDRRLIQIYALKSINEFPRKGILSRPITRLSINSPTIQWNIPAVFNVTDAAPNSVAAFNCLGPHASPCDSPNVCTTNSGGNCTFSITFGTGRIIGNYNANVKVGDTNSNSVAFSLVEQIKCTDSDGGRNYHEQGTANGIKWGTDNAVSEVDYCVTEGEKAGRLAEFYCDSNQVASISYECPNGCKDGACLRECPKDIRSYPEYSDCPNFVCNPGAISVQNPKTCCYECKSEPPPLLEEGDESIIHLEKGWNLISSHFADKSGVKIPFVKLSNDCKFTSGGRTSEDKDKVLLELVKVDNKYKYQKTAYLAPKKGYLVKVDNDCDIQLKGELTTIGEFVSKHAVTAVTSFIGGAPEKIRFDEIKGSCEPYNPSKTPNKKLKIYSLNPSLNRYEESQFMEHGKGYLIRVQSNCQLGFEEEAPPALPED